MVSITTANEPNTLLQGLIDDCWRDYCTHREDPFVVKPAVPILFFGDIQRYQASPLRIVTVGLNPSRVEFPAEDRFKRFPQASKLDSTQGDAAFTPSYLAALSDYFRVCPYRKWFNSYEYVLHGLHASYDDSRQNTAIHTDLCSSLATDPTWSKLSPTQRAVLDTQGKTLWHRLIAYLAPDILIASVAKGLLDAITFGGADDWRTIYTLIRKNPYHVQAKRLHIANGKIAHLIFGKAANTPFGTVSQLDRETIGTHIQEYFYGK